MFSSILEKMEFESDFLWVWMAQESVVEMVKMNG